MNGLIITPKITVSFTKEHWDLYPDTPDEVVFALNQKLETLVNSGNPERIVSDEMFKEMQKFSEHGACDSEPMRFIEYVLDKIYPKPR